MKKLIVLIFFSFIISSCSTKYDNYQSFALDTKDLVTYDDIVNRFGNPSSDQNFSDYTYYTVFYKNIKVQERGFTKIVFFKVDRNTDIIVGSGLY